MNLTIVNLSFKTGFICLTSLYEKKIIKSSKGSSVVFDGRTLHRGLDNDSNNIRYALYISYYKGSYVDKEGLLSKLL